MLLSASRGGKTDGCPAPRCWRGLRSFLLPPELLLPNLLLLGLHLAELLVDKPLYVGPLLEFVLVELLLAVLRPPDLRLLKLPLLEVPFVELALPAFSLGALPPLCLRHAVLVHPVPQLFRALLDGRLQLRAIGRTSCTTQLLAQRGELDGGLLHAVLQLGLRIVGAPVSSPLLREFVLA